MGQGKRGYALENAIEYTNNIYKNKGWALVHKVPTPWKVMYNKRTGQVYKAYPQEKSTVDFEGMSHGRGLAFDAKSTKNKSSFPLNNIKEHQIEFLKDYRDQGGIAFFIVHFEKHQETYFLYVTQLVDWWENMKYGGRKSIPLNWFKLNCDLIKAEKGVPLHYLAHCNTAFKRAERRVKS